MMMELDMDYLPRSGSTGDPGGGAECADALVDRTGTGVCAALDRGADGGDSGVCAAVYDYLAGGLAVEVVDGLADGLADLSGGVLYISDDAVGGALVGEVLVAGEIADALLDGSGDGGGFALDLLLGAPGECLMGCVGQVVVDGFIGGLRLTG